MRGRERLPFRSFTLSFLSILGFAAPVAAQTVKMTVALDTLVARAARDSTDPVALYNLGVGYWMTGQFDAADAALRRADRIDPRFAEVSLALAYLPYGKRPKLWKEESKGTIPPDLVPVVNEANDRFRRTFMLDPMVDMRVVGLVIPPRDAIVIGRNADRYYAALMLGLEYFYGANYESAFSSLEDAYKFTSPKDRDQIPDWVLWYHGLAAAHIEHNGTAIADFQELLQRRLQREKSDSIRAFAVLPSNNTRYVLATILRRAGHLQEATEEFQQVLSTDLSFEMAHAQLAEIAEEDGKWDVAVMERQRALEASPGDAGLLLDYGTTLAKARRFKEATAVLTQAQEAMPLNSRVPYLLGQAAIADGRTDEAMAAFRRFAEIAPSRYGVQVKQLEAKYGSLRAN